MRNRRRPDGFQEVVVTGVRFRFVPERAPHDSVLSTATARTAQLTKLRVVSIGM